jgi:glycosyltransferase domain-containing protein
MCNVYLDKITIIIFSYNRHRFLKRTIEYWSKHNVRLVILDGSDNRMNEKYLNKKNIKYFHDKRGLFERLLSSVDYIDTEFMILGSDDEFYLPSTLSLCVKFLIDNKNFSCCGGRSLGFGINKKKIFGRKIYPKLKNFKLDNDLVHKRIQKHFLNYVPAHIYSVMRTYNWRVICNHVFKKEYNFDSNWEIQIEFLTIAAGKSKIIENLMWLRNLTVEPIRYKYPFIAPQLSIIDWWHSKDNEKEKINFLKRIKITCDEFIIDNKNQLSHDDILNLFETYVEKLSAKKNSLIVKNKVKKIWNIIKGIIKFIIQWDKIKAKSLKSCAKKLESQGVIINYTELNQVISILKQSK